MASGEVSPEVEVELAASTAVTAATTATAAMVEAEVEQAECKSVNIPIFEIRRNRTGNNYLWDTKLTNSTANIKVT